MNREDYVAAMAEQGDVLLSLWLIEVIILGAFLTNTLSRWRALGLKNDTSAEALKAAVPLVAT